MRKTYTVWFAIKVTDMKKLKIRKLAALFTSKQFTQKDNDRNKTNTVIKAPDLG